jgi:hypothetical protein
MAKTEYEERRFAAKTRRVIDQANEIMDEYGGGMTIRQLHYQFVARDLYENTQRNYKRLGDILRNARMGGLVDWDQIEDRTRGLYGKTTSRGPEQAIDRASWSYYEDVWDTQPVRIEVWIEKNALTGVITPATSRHRVDYFPTIGYPSITSLKDAADRMIRINEQGGWGDLDNPQKVIVLYLSDHDPEGFQMVEKADEVLRTLGVQNLEVRRIGLTMEQVEQFQPPPSFAKETSSRYDAYVDEHGTTEAWELDALEPEVIQGLIEAEILKERDPEIWDARMEAEEESKERMREISNRYGEIVAFLDRDSGEW